MPATFGERRNWEIVAPTVAAPARHYAQLVVQIFRRRCSPAASGAGVASARGHPGDGKPICNNRNQSAY